eukprot:gnl/TRDRNA2_/TRDRNA2_82227_c0_seq1.p1 gnl/TRDRNA2_/TRDRNA2_82227_c0~~gnl/TRDRNA2_/TRDRNA2_82227_c0_seq1.p1  ORF type:complete len:177 (+),score=55.11 gnl/TRDRNA2_/TRDRNA2_82227_c0_seq1:2-532(+)
MGSRTRANVLITGTPGTGKSTLCDALATASGGKLRHIEVGKLVKEKKLYREWDEEMDCSIFDEEMVTDALEPLVEDGGALVDFHSAACLPEDWFDLVVVLRAETDVLYARLEKRHYDEAKIRQNVEAEIFQVCLDEAREAFEDSDVKIWELHHNTQEHLDEAIQRLKQFIEEWVPT